MDKYLITQTLLSAWLYTVGNDSEDAYTSFLRTLNREPSEQTQAMLDGILFEDYVYALANDELTELPDHPEWTRGARIIAERLRGAQIQVSIYRDVTVDGVTYTVHGKLDALKAGTIHDVKKSSRSFGSVELAGKYFESPQHSAYFYLVPEATLFEYDVSDGEDFYTEVYTPANTRHISEYIREFIAFLTETGLLPIYQDKWKVR